MIPTPTRPQSSPDESPWPYPAIDSNPRSHSKVDVATRERGQDVVPVLSLRRREARSIHPRYVTVELALVLLISHESRLQNIREIRLQAMHETFDGECSNGKVTSHVSTTQKVTRVQRFDHSAWLQQGACCSRHVAQAALACSQLLTRHYRRTLTFIKNFLLLHRSPKPRVLGQDPDPPRPPRTRPVRAHDADVEKRHVLPLRMSTGPTLTD